MGCNLITRSAGSSATLQQQIYDRYIMIALEPYAVPLRANVPFTMTIRAAAVTFPKVMEAHAYEAHIAMTWRYG